MDTGIENARRVVHWIDMLHDDTAFTRENIFNDLNTNDVHVSFYTIDKVLDSQINNGKLEVVSSKGMPQPILRKVKKVDKSIEDSMANIRTLAEKILDKIDQMPDKPKNDTEKRLSDLEVKYKWLEEIVAKMHYEKPEKQRLWSANDPIPLEVEYIDVMYTDGRVVENYYIRNMPLMGADVLAWREAK